VDSRRPNISIAFFDHGLDDALFHCQGQLQHAQRQLSDQYGVALTLNGTTVYAQVESGEQAKGITIRLDRARAQSGRERARSRSGRLASVGTEPPHTARRRAQLRLGQTTAELYIVIEMGTGSDYNTYTLFTCMYGFSTRLPSLLLQRQAMHLSTPRAW
jgi:hypothetical protein